MKRSSAKLNQNIKAAMSVDEFLDWHEDPNNYPAQSSTFDAVYRILDQYGSEDGNVDEAYAAASPEDQEKITMLIRNTAEKRSKIFKDIINNESFSYTIRGTELKLTGHRTGRFVCIDLFRIPDSVIDKIADC